MKVPDGFLGSAKQASVYGLEKLTIHAVNCLPPTIVNPSPSSQWTEAIKPLMGLYRWWCINKCVRFPFDPFRWNLTEGTGNDHSERDVMVSTNVKEELAKKSSKKSGSELLCKRCEARQAALGLLYSYVASPDAA
ncbi:hypothetical protein QBC32DRAFT_340773 [Pseudoneurospora amorphoporcata]|uniref:Uncharacterized protein n=1 Tax=Pseudoneurospora amorphoporcata TaxID=241081 RepID=A0AAN6SFS8_9PEZI|nr:hypothetical protein QBC32DRAFT_340773 [Pseudoneurospora amorphoporcata]